MINHALTEQTWMRIIVSSLDDNGHSNETFLNIPPIPLKTAEIIADALNDATPTDYDHFWEIVPDDYILQSEFKP